MPAELWSTRCAGSLGEPARQHMKAFEPQQLTNTLHGMAKAQYTSQYTPADPLVLEALRGGSGHVQSAGRGQHAGRLRTWGGNPGRELREPPGWRGGHVQGAELAAWLLR
jgi:hypothetical protein